VPTTEVELGHRLYPRPQGSRATSARSSPPIRAASCQRHGGPRGRQNFFPPYNLALTVRKDVYDKNAKELDSIFNPIAEKLDTETLQGAQRPGRRGRAAA
jgi:hypothetical protein